MRGSPHVHSFIWILTPYVEFIDNTIHDKLPASNDDPVLYEILNQYQTHKHSKSCRKYKNRLSTYGFGKFFTVKIIIARPLEDGIKEVESYSILKKREQY